MRANSRLWGRITSCWGCCKIRIDRLMIWKLSETRRYRGWGKITQISRSKPITWTIWSASWRAKSPKKITWLAGTTTITIINCRHWGSKFRWKSSKMLSCPPASAIWGWHWKILSRSGSEEGGISLNAATSYKANQGSTRRNISGSARSWNQGSTTLSTLWLIRNDFF